MRYAYTGLPKSDLFEAFQALTAKRHSLFTTKRHSALDAESLTRIGTLAGEGILVRIFDKIFSLDFERSDPNNNLPSLIFSRIFSLDFEQDFEKFSIKTEVPPLRGFSNRTMDLQAIFMLDL